VFEDGELGRALLVIFCAFWFLFHIATGWERGQPQTVETYSCMSPRTSSVRVRETMGVSLGRPKNEE
jgi:hypothetical protein